MNKVLILLLVTLVQSQSDGVLLPTSNTNDSQLEDMDGSELPFSVEVSNDQNSQPYGKRSVTSDAFTRRSALDKNFMRFGRGDEKPCGRGHSNKNLSFYRFGRGLKDSFIRFGRARDNFIRFGRGGGKDGFIRFGRAHPEDFFRSGKSLRENFIRFGKTDKNFMRFGKADKNFMRFGRGGGDEDYQEFISSEEPFQRLEKSPKSQDNFMRFGKSGKNGTNFLRFGKSDSDADEAEDTSEDANLLKGAERKKRDASAVGAPSRVSKRSPGFFEAPPENFPRRIFPLPGGSWQGLESLRNSRLTPFVPVYSNFPKAPIYEGSEEEMGQVGSNFARFG